MEENLCFYVSMSRNFHNGKYVVWQVSNSACSRSRIFREGWDSDLACVCRKKAKIRADFFRTALFCAALLRWEAEMAEMAFRGRDYGRIASVIFVTRGRDGDPTPSQIGQSLW